MSCCDKNSTGAAAANGTADSVRDDVKEYYGKTLQATADLKTGVCQMGGPSMPAHVRQAIKNVHEEVKNKYYGCGFIIPDNLADCRVLDLGSGAGLDCYVLSKLVGEKGHVTGLDMTDEQLEVARKYIDHHTEKYGYKSPNIDFVQGYIERLKEAGIPQNSFDIIVSNCVVNLSPDKKAVLSEAYNALKEGGELFFSDIYADKTVPDDVRKHKVLWGEGLAGALWWEDLHTIAAEVGFSAPRLLTANEFDISKQELVEVLGDLKYVSATYRLFKLPAESIPPCGVVYEGDIEHCQEQFVLDHKHTFKTGSPETVGKEVATILKSSRFADHFEFQSVPKIQNTEENLKEDNPFEFAAASAGCCGPKTTGGCC